MEDFLNDMSQRLDLGLAPVCKIIEKEHQRMLGDCYNCVKECYFREAEDPDENKECIEYCRDRAYQIQTEIQEKIVRIQKSFKECAWGCEDASKKRKNFQSEPCLKLCTENTIWDFIKLRFRFQELNEIRFQPDSISYSLRKIFLKQNR